MVRTIETVVFCYRRVGALVMLYRAVIQHPSMWVLGDGVDGIVTVPQFRKVMKCTIGSIKSICLKDWCTPTLHISNCSIFNFAKTISKPLTSGSVQGY